MLKPAEQTPLSALRLGELIQEPGFPDGVVNIVTGYCETAGAAITHHPDVDNVSFTASTEVGKLIVQAAAGNLKRVSLELGGKWPSIIVRDADLDQAIAGAAQHIFFNHGQSCVAGSRLFVEKSVYDQVVDGISSGARAIKLGDSFDPESQMGPTVSDVQQQRVAGFIDAGLAEGATATATAGGRKRAGRGYFVEPTVLTNVNNTMRVSQEEIFGPILVAQPFESIDELITKANDTQYGLACAVWTKDVNKANRVAQAVRAGSIYVNCHSVVDPAMPCGGFKQSGWGRELGTDSIDAHLAGRALSRHDPRHRSAVRRTRTAHAHSTTPTDRFISRACVRP